MAEPVISDPRRRGSTTGPASGLSEPEAAGPAARLPARLRPVGGGDYAPEGRAYSLERERTSFLIWNKIERNP